MGGVLRPRGWAPEFRRWMALPEAKENLTHRATSRAGSCVFLADPDEFGSHPWFGEINLLYVDADGTVVPCCMHPQAGVFGNLRTHKFSEILNGEGRRQFKDADAPQSRGDAGLRRLRHRARGQGRRIVLEHDQRLDLQQQHVAGAMTKTLHATHSWTRRRR